MIGVLPRVRSLAAGTVLASALFIGACGSAAPPTILNTEKVESAIERSALEQRQTVARVSCPSGVHQQKGKGFTCTAAVANGSARFRVTQLDDAGRVRYEASR